MQKGPGALNTERRQVLFLHVRKVGHLCRRQDARQALRQGIHEFFVGVLPPRAKRLDAVLLPVIVGGGADCIHPLLPHPAQHGHRHLH